MQDRFPGFDHLAELQPDACRCLREHLADCLSQMLFHRCTVDRGEPFVDLAVSQISVEIAEPYRSLSVNTLQGFPLLIRRFFTHAVL